MKKIWVVLIVIVLVIALLQVTAPGVEAKAKCNGRNWRNPHCRPAATVTVTSMATAGVRVTAVQGTPEYWCLSLGCATLTPK